jgi:uncharacterized protein YggU (UPF0235/DUF167 family)
MSEAVLVEPWEGTGASFHVKAHAGAKRDRVAGTHDGMLRVEVTTAPEKGKANKAIQKLLAKALDIPSGDLTLLSGETNQKKRFGITGISPKTLREKIQAVL